MIQMKPYRILTVISLMTVLIAIWSCGGSSGSSFEPSVDLEEVFPGASFSQPVAVLQHPDETERWYVVEQSGVVQTVATTDPSATQVFIDISDRVTFSGEAGLLGMAFHPNFAGNQLIFLCYTGPGSPLITYVSSFVASADGLTADPDSETVLFSVAQPYTNHNGGWIDFGSDGFLYIALGDGGDGGDPDGNGQNTQTWLGAILRIDVDNDDLVRGTPYAIPADNPFSANNDCTSDDGCPEIYAYGFRNPWRGSFDIDTGDLWVGDVGQGAREEIDWVDPDVGRNYGWNIMEGDLCFNATTCDITGLVLPVVDYGRSDGRSVTGGYIYRGSELPEFFGDYIYGDFVTGRIWRIIDAENGGFEVEELNRSGLNISAFGQDRSGEVYVVSYGDGRIYRLTPI